MDLKQYDVIAAAEEGAELRLRDPATNEPLDARIVMVGSDSERFRAAQSKEQERMLRRKQGGEKIEAGDWSDSTCRILAQCVVSWSDIAEGDQELECTEANARRVFRQYPWVREQADEFVHKRANFLATSPSDS